METTLTPDPTKKRTIAEMSVESRLLIARLQKAEVGELLTYDHLAGEVGMAVGPSFKSRLYTARHCVLVDHGIHFGTVSGEGVRRSDGAGKLADMESGTSSIRRVAHRKLAIARHIDLTALSPAEQTRYNATVSHLGVLHSFTKSTAVKRIHAAVEKQQAQLPLTQTLEAFQAKE